MLDAWRKSSGRPDGSHSLTPGRPGMTGWLGLRYLIWLYCPFRRVEPAGQGVACANFSPDPF